MGAIVRRGDELLLIRRAHEPAAGEWSSGRPGGARRDADGGGDARAARGDRAAWCLWPVGRLGRAHRRRSALRDPGLRGDGDRRSHPSAGSDASEARWWPVSEVAKLQLVEGLAEFLHDHGVIRRSFEFSGSWGLSGFSVQPVGLWLLEPSGDVAVDRVACLGAVHGYEGDLAVGIEVDHWASSPAIDAGGGGGGRRFPGRADSGWMSKSAAIWGTRSASLRIAASRSSSGLVGMPAGITCVRTGRGRSSPPRWPSVAGWQWG